MPVWASILVTVVAGVGAGSFAAWLTARNDRQERFRDRLLEAADDFTVAAADALVKLRDAIREVRDSKDHGRMKEATEEAWGHHDIALRRSARLDLLFGVGSDTTGSASRFLNQMAIASQVLRPPDCDADRGEKVLVDATAELQTFNRSAFDAIRHAAPPSATLRESLRRHLGRRHDA
jgi:hypothetical protein